MKKADIGLIGLAVMGENLVLNMESHGYTVAVFNRTVSKVDNFINGRAKGKKIIGAHSIKDLVNALQKPRRVMLMVKAGAAVDEFIGQLCGVLEPGDIIIDGGNSLFADTTRRCRACAVPPAGSAATARCSRCRCRGRARAAASRCCLKCWR